MTSWKDKLALTAQRNRQEIVKAKLDRREMMRLGLLTAGGALIAKAGLSSRAFGQAAPTLTDPDATLSRVPASPPVPPVGAADAAPDGDDAGGPATTWSMACPDGTTPIDGATKRIPHQYCSYTPPTPTARRSAPTGQPGEPHLQLRTTEVLRTGDEGVAILKLHPDYATTRFFAFDEHGSRAADQGEIRRADHGAL